MYIKRDLYLTKTPFKITYEFKWLPIQGIYCVQTGSCSNYDGKFKSVGCNKFTKLQLGKVSVILGKERILSWKGKDPFLSQERSSLQLGKVSVILGKERILSFPRMVKRKASKGERKGFRPSLDINDQILQDYQLVLAQSCRRGFSNLEHWY